MSSRRKSAGVLEFVIAVSRAKISARGSFPQAPLAKWVDGQASAGATHRTGLLDLHPLHGELLVSVSVHHPKADHSCDDQSDTAKSCSACRIS